MRGVANFETNLFFGSRCSLGFRVHLLPPSRLSGGSYTRTRNAISSCTLDPTLLHPDLILECSNFSPSCSALLAVPEGMAEGSWPELRLLPGLYTGNRNVFIGGIGDTEYPSAAR